MKRVISRVKIYLIMTFFSICALGVTKKMDSQRSERNIYLNHVGATKCWKGTCGHKSTYYEYGSYTSSNRKTTYYYTGYYLDPGAQQTVSFTKSVSQSISIGGDIGGDVAKASVGFTGGVSVTKSVSQSQTNNTKSRKYVHMGVETANRSNTVTKKKRTYNPTWHATATKKTCRYSSIKAYPKATVVTGVGMSLRGKIQNG